MAYQVHNLRGVDNGRFHLMLEDTNQNLKKLEHRVRRAFHLTKQWKCSITRKAIFVGNPAPLPPTPLMSISFWLPK